MATIRILGEADAEPWYDLRLQALADTPEAFSEDLEEARAASVDHYRRRFTIEAAARSPIFGAFEEGVLVATVGLWRQERIKERHKALIWGVYVDPAHRGRGLARGLIEAAIAHAKAQPGLRQLFLSAGTYNDRAVALYASLGFETYGIEPRALNVGGQDYDETHMWLCLAP